jgi:predicted dehydrogenase
VIAVWTRFFPLTLQLQKFIHEEKSIGRVTRVIVDFGLETPLKEQPVGSRVSNLPLGAGVLLDIGVYSLTWASLALNDPSHPEDTDVEVSSALSSNRGIDELATVVLNYPRKLAQAICTASYLAKSDPEFGRIEGEEGSIQIIGRTASKPSSLILRRKGEEAQRFDVGVDGMGFFYEADAVARCIRSGQRECEVMPLRESLRVMRLLDEVRRQNGMRYPQDDE